MKSILVLTNFSTESGHAARYSYRLASELKLNLVLCNATVIPTELPEAGSLVWPMETLGQLLRESSSQLHHLKAALEQTGSSLGYTPTISVLSEPGMLVDVVDDAISTKNFEFIAMATHGSEGLTGFLMGNHSHKMIDQAPLPLMLIPPSAAITPLLRIGFATDYRQFHHEMAAMLACIEMAKRLHSQVVLTHVTTNPEDEEENFSVDEDFLKTLSERSGYLNISQQQVKNKRITKGLHWLIDHSPLDILAMVHRKHGFLTGIFKASTVQELASGTPIPLFIYPGL